MSEVRINVHEADSGNQAPHGASCPEQLKPPRTDPSSMDLKGLPPPLSSPSAGVSPSPSAESSDLLSLPWEILTHIASFLPAHCLVNVLPKVCHTLGTVSEDNRAWQLRAQRLIGSKARFPVGPRDDFNWAASCLEMELLITCWAADMQQLAKQSEENEEEWDQGRLQDGGLVSEGLENEGGGRGGQVDGVEVAAQEVAYGADEGLEFVMEAENGEMPPVLDGDQMARLREEFEGRLEDEAPALIEDGGVEQDAADLDQNNFAYLRHLNNREQVEMIQQPFSKGSSPPPALECITLPPSHIATINSVLLLGGEGVVCATASRDYDVKLWDLQAGPEGALPHTLRRKGNLTSHRGWAWCLASNGPLLASGSFDSTVGLWDLQAGGANTGLIKAGGPVSCLSYQTDVLVAGTVNKTINMYDTRAAEPLIKSIRLHGLGVICLTADDTYIISGSEDCTVAVYDRRAMKALKKIKLSSYLSSMSYSGREVWAGDNKGLLRTFSMQSGNLTLLSQFDVGHRGLVTGIHRSPGSLYTCSTDRTVKIHLPSGKPRTLSTLCHRSTLHGLSVEAGILAVSTGDTVNIWRPRK